MNPVSFFFVAEFLQIWKKNFGVLYRHHLKMLSVLNMVPIFIQMIMVVVFQQQKIFHQFLMIKRFVRFFFLLNN